MLTKKQLNWLSSLSDKDKIFIKAYDKKSPYYFERIKKYIRKEIDKKLIAEHHGASRLKISGQDEIDIYVPISKNNFDEYVDKFKMFFGVPRSLYKNNRARFVSEKFGKHIDIFIIDNESEDWKSLNIFEEYLLTQPEQLSFYEKLKEDSANLGMRSYYKNKLEFINHILKVSSSSKLPRK